MKIAILSDIHGNRWALEAVLQDMNRRGIDLAVNLGDCAYGPLDPSGTLELLTDLDWPTVSGNEDRLLIDSAQCEVDQKTLRFTRDALTESQLRWIAELPASLILDGFFCCHGTPRQDTVYLMQEAGRESVRLRSEQDIASRLSGVAQKMVLCGHDHVPRVMIACGSLIINPGSVGLQAYTDDIPYPHCMETGSPHARYAVASKTGASWSFEIIAVPYDWDSAAKTAEGNGNPSWAAWLRTGRAG